MLSTAKQYLGITDANFIGIFLYGSQNYHLDCDNSDVDTILLIRAADKPKQEISMLIGKVKIYTLKYFIYRLKQGDLECYEILYTKYNILNPTYANLLESFVKEFTNCLNYELIKCSLYKKLDEHLSHVLWMLTNKEKARYNKKRLYWAMRVCNQLERINNGECFESSLIYDNSYDLRSIKTITNHLSLKDFSNIYRCLTDYMVAAPRFSVQVTEEEERCLSDFYTNLNTKGGSLS